MKKLIALLFITSTFYAQEKSFTLNLEVKGLKDNEQVFLTHKYNDDFIFDSALVSKEKVTFKGTTPEPNMYWVTLQKNVNPTLIFFIDAGKIEITANKDSLNKAKIKAGKTQEDYKWYMDYSAAFIKNKEGLLKRFQACSQKGDQACAKAIQDSANQNERNLVKTIVGFIKKNPESNVGAYIIFSTAFDWPSIPEYDEMYNALGKKVVAGKFGKLALDKLNSIKGTTIGYPAIDFSQADPDGKNISLSSYKGKVVLVDFWASWCGPCRAENPNVVAAYNKYKSKGFDVFGVSFDDNKDKWIKAIAKDGLAWQQVSDLKGWQNAAGKIYGVTSIPFNLLLDKDGKILAKGLRGADLDAMLEKLLGK